MSERDSYSSKKAIQAFLLLSETDRMALIATLDGRDFPDPRRESGRGDVSRLS